MSKEKVYKAPKNGLVTFIPGRKVNDSTKMSQAKVLRKFEVGKGVDLQKEDALKLQNASFGKVKNL